MARTPATSTQTLLEGSGSEGEATQPCLILALDSGRLFAPPLRMSLAAVDELVIGRGTPRGVAREIGDGDRRLVRVQIDDPFLSSVHARLLPFLGRWRLEDAGSKNGTVVNGTAIKKQIVEDGDVLELGRCFFVFRAAVPNAAGAPLDAEPEPAPAPGLATLRPELVRLFATLAEVARAGVSVIVHGEVGSGKEVIARAVHGLSRRSGAFIAVNCGSLPESLIESELFGHRKGSFSGALEDRPGLVRSADRGTLFLDEIGELPLSSQVAFLRVLQEREVVPVGGSKPVAVDIRVVAATHRNLGALVDGGRFRADLFSRLGGFTVELPALRQRREDLGIIIAALLGPIGAQAKEVTLRPRAARCLFQYEWPGNVRELQKCLGAAVVLARGGTVDVEHLPASIQAAAPGSRSSAELNLSDSSPPVRENPTPPQAPAPAAEIDEDDTHVGLPPHEVRRRDELIALLTQHDGNASAIARQLGKSPGQIRRWLRRWTIDPDDYRR